MRIVQRTVKRLLSCLPWRSAPAAAASGAFSSREYWEARYQQGGDSGVGSYGELAALKAKALNDFVRSNAVRSVIEFGCGDGNQLSLATYPSYIGLDVSHAVLARCRDRFATDKTKSFFAYDPDCFVDHHGLFTAELAMSLDVIYHLVEDVVFETYMRHLFAAARRFVVVYSTDQEYGGTASHVRHRRFTPWIAERMPNWRLLQRIRNQCAPTDPAYSGPPFADFFFYQIADGSDERHGSPGAP